MTNNEYNKIKNKNKKQKTHYTIIILWIECTWLRSWNPRSQVYTCISIVQSIYSTNQVIGNAYYERIINIKNINNNYYKNEKQNEMMRYELNMELRLGTCWNLASKNKNKNKNEKNKNEKTKMKKQKWKKEKEKRKKKKEKRERKKEKGNK